jgi:hypothetical protein
MPTVVSSARLWATTTMTPPLAAAIEATLVATRHLLNNCLGPHASPSSAEQWCHNVDQLIVATISMPPHRGRWANHFGGGAQPSVVHSCTPTVAHAPSASCVSVVSITMTDLWAKLEHRRLGEVGHITIESHCERHRNLEGDYGTPIAAPIACATHTPISPGVMGGCVAPSPHLRMVVWPRKFWPHVLERYDGSINFAEFLKIYSTSILAIGGMSPSWATTSPWPCPVWPDHGS